MTWMEGEDSIEGRVSGCSSFRGDEDEDEDGDDGDGDGEAEAEGEAEGDDDDGGRMRE